MSLPRRSFLARLGAAAAAFTAAGAAPAAAQGAPQGRALLKHPQDAWLDAMPGAHRVILDGPTPTGALEAAGFAWNFLRTSGAPYGLKDADHAVVVTLRHQGTNFAFPQALWDKYPVLAQGMEVDHPVNHAKVAKSLLRRGTVVEPPAMDDVTLEALAARGVHVAVCGAATQRLSRMIAGKDGAARAQAVYDELVASLPPNAHVMASGMVALQRAQQVGFAYVRAG